MTIFPASCPGRKLTPPSDESVQRSLGWPAISFARTTGVGVEIPEVIVAPGSTNVSPLSAVMFIVPTKCRFDVDAPTVFVHGPAWFAVAAPGPLFPAEALT